MKQVGSTRWRRRKDERRKEQQKRQKMTLALCAVMVRLMVAFWKCHSRMPPSFCPVHMVPAAQQIEYCGCSHHHCL